MIIKNITTKSEFYKFADIWYQRVHRLREVCQNAKETDERKAKAFTLWLIMYDRVMKLTQIAIKINQPDNLPQFESGGVCKKN